MTIGDPLLRGLAVVLDLIKSLIRALEKENVSYCHWKSNTAMEETLSGINDLDLLVATEDKEKFLSVISRLNFYRAYAVNERWFPSICHYYGYDDNSGRIVHIHLHFKLILGHDLVKNYHLPLEKIFLQSATSSTGLKTPSIELELIVLVIRMVLKRRLVSLFFGNPLDLLNAFMGRFRKGLSKSAQNELDDLQRKADKEILKRYLSEYFPFISLDLFDCCLASISSGAEKYDWLTAGRRLTRALTPFRRHSLIATAFLFPMRGIALRLNNIFCKMGLRIPTRKRLEHGGKIIAFVGGDGAGKSTNVKEFASWFGKYFMVRAMHLGKPTKGFLWYALGSILKVRRLILRRSSDDFHKSIICWLVARYRFKAFGRAVRMRSRGYLVCLDRIPLPGMRYMDAPQIRHLAGDKGIYGRLAILEERYHAGIRGADEIIILRLDPAVAAQRRPEDDQGELALRSGEVWDKQWPPGYANIVDASAPLDEVQRQIRKIVWVNYPKSPKVIELVGPAGSGKSTAAKLLNNETCNVQTSISVKNHKIQFISICLQRLPTFCGCIIRGVPLKYFKIMVKTETVLTIIQKHKKHCVLPCRNLVLDVGPVFHLAYLHKEGIYEKIPSLKQLDRKVLDSIDMIFWLDAPNKVLQMRVDGREKGHRMKNKPVNSMNKFYNDYRACFDKIIYEFDGKMPHKYLNTEKMTVENVSNVINAYL